MADRGHRGHAWRQMWRAVIYGPDFLVCAICHQPIDRNISGRTSRAPSVDLKVPYSRGGDPLDPGNLRPAHYGCNSSRGNRVQVRRHWVRDDTP